MVVSPVYRPPAPDAVRADPHGPCRFRISGWRPTPEHPPARFRPGMSVDYGRLLLSSLVPPPMLAPAFILSSGPMFVATSSDLYFANHETGELKLWQCHRTLTVDGSGIMGRSTCQRKTQPAICRCRNVEDSEGRMLAHAVTDLRRGRPEHRPRRRKRVWLPTPCGGACPTTTTPVGDHSDATRPGRGASSVSVSVSAALLLAVAAGCRPWMPARKDGLPSIGRRGRRRTWRGCRRGRSSVAGCWAAGTGAGA